MKNLTSSLINTRNQRFRRWVRIQATSLQTLRQVIQTKEATRTNNNHQLSVGYFPTDFNGNKNSCTLEVKPSHIMAAEEVPKIKRSIKQGKVIEENCGSKFNHFKGTELGAQSGKYVLFVYEDKKFRAYCIDNLYDFKKQVVDVDPALQEELLNYSNDPAKYDAMRSKSKTKLGADKMIEDIGKKAREQAGIDDLEEHEKKLAFTNYARK